MATLHDNYSDYNGKGLAKYTMSVTVMMTGVAAHKIRRLEEFGLCRPARTGSKQRLFSDEDIEIIRRINTLERDGVNLPGIRVIFNLSKSNQMKDRRKKL